MSKSLLVLADDRSKIPIAELELLFKNLTIEGAFNLDLLNTKFDVLIVDLDNSNVQDCEGFKELLALYSKSIFIICGLSSKRLNYYNDFSTHTSWKDLLLTLKLTS